MLPIHEKDAVVWTPEQELAQEIFAYEGFSEESLQRAAYSTGVNKKTVEEWCKHPQWWHTVVYRSIEMYRGSIPSILKNLTNLASTGTGPTAIAAAKTVLMIMGNIKPPEFVKNVSSDNRKIIINSHDIASASKDELRSMLEEHLAVIDARPNDEE